MPSFLALEQIDAIFQSVQFKHLSTSDPERLPRRMLPCAPAHVKMQDVAVYQIHDVPLRRMEDQSPRLAIRIPTKGTISLGFTESLSCCVRQRKIMPPDSRRLATFWCGSNPESLRSQLCATKIRHRADWN
jgi:hypothetical protein